MSDLPKIGAPASRALSGARITTMQDLTQYTEAEIGALHGMGPKALALLREALHQAGLKFKTQRP